MRRRLALLSASVALAALLVAGGAAWAATLSFAPAKGYPAGDAPNGVAAGDLDGDGDQDLMSANSGGGFTDGRPDYSILGTVSVFKNRGDGTFAAARNFTAGGAFEPSRLDRSDFDGDGDLDLVVSLQFTRAGDGGACGHVQRGRRLLRPAPEVRDLVARVRHRQRSRRGRRPGPRNDGD